MATNKEIEQCCELPELKKTEKVFTTDCYSISCM